MAKVIRINDSGYIWDVPLEAIAKHRAEDYVKGDPHTTFQAEFDYVMDDDYEGLDWFLNNMDFEDVEKGAKFIQAPPPLTKPRINSSECECEIIETMTATALDATAYIDIVFDGPPGPEAGRFVEVEDTMGRSINFGSWVQRDDGYWVLRIEQYPGAGFELRKLATPGQAAIKEMIDR